MQLTSVIFTKRCSYEEDYLKLFYIYLYLNVLNCNCANNYYKLKSINLYVNRNEQNAKGNDMNIVIVNTPTQFVQQLIELIEPIKDNSILKN